MCPQWKDKVVEVIGGLVVVGNHCFLIPVFLCILLIIPTLRLCVFVGGGYSKSAFLPSSQWDANPMAAK